MKKILITVCITISLNSMCVASSGSFSDPFDNEVTRTLSRQSSQSHPHIKPAQEVTFALDNGPVL